MFPSFQPCYVFPTELAQYSLPTPDINGDIIPLVFLASNIIDEACGRIDGDGNGSLVFTTYTSRILMQTRNRNLFEIPMKPVSAVTPDTVAILQAAATGMPWALPDCPASSGNFAYTGVIGNTLSAFTGSLSGIVSASGRYGYTRQDMSIAYPDLWAMINPLNLLTMFGGPAPWIAIDITQTDYDSKTGECWPPVGLQLQRYSEVLMSYNSGFNPLKMPSTIKTVCAAIVKNAMAKGSGTTAMLSFTMNRSGANARFFNDLIDPRLDAMLTPFKNVRSY